MTRQRMIGIALGAAMLAAGAGGFMGLSSLRKPPAEASQEGETRKLAVQVIRLQPTDVQVTVRGYGEVRSRRTVEIAPEISGSVIDTHPAFVAGGVVSKGEVLFRVDPRPYESAFEQAQARIALWEASVRRLNTEFAAARDRFETLNRSVELAKARYDRARELYRKSIGNQTDVESAEQAYNEAKDAAAQLQQRLTAFPLQIEEAKQQRAAEKANQKQAALRLEYTEVRAPFDCRITDIFVELGQYVSEGERAVRIADDSALEIPVKLDAREARTWLRFDQDDVSEHRAWFTGLQPVPSRVSWVEQPGDAVWEGRLDRVERFDPDTRTVTVVVRVSAQEAQNCPGESAPLVAGMFCEVAVPGRVLHDVFAVPRSAISVDRKVYLANGEQLQSAAADVVRIEGDTVLIQNGLQSGDLVITTRLVNPLENTPLTITKIDAAPARP